MNKHKLSYRLINGLVLMFILLGISISVIISVRVRGQMLEEYSKLAFGSAHTVAGLIDGDRIDHYLDTKERDDYYYEVRNHLNEIQSNFDLMYCYVFVPYEDHLTYIWASDDEGKLIIGYDDVYSDGGKEIAYMAFSKKPVYKMISDTDKEYGEFMVACVPIYDSVGEPVALAASDISTKQVKTAIFKSVLGVVSFIFIFMILVIVMFYRYIKRKFITPVLILNNAAINMAEDVSNGESTDIDVHTGDELESLARSFEKMNEELLAYVSENNRITAEKERIGAELDMAKEIQAGQLPSVFPAFPDRTEFDICATMTPAKEVGGDFYDFFFVDDDHLALVIADVSGKGVPAALFMMMSKILINNYAMMGLSPAEVLTRTNETICMNNKQKMFVTVWFGILEISTGKVTAANAGHEYPIIRQPDGKFELFKDKHGFVIGGMKNKKYKQYEFTLQKGGTLFVYTDGVPEATNAKEEMFGTDKTVEVLNLTPDAMPQQLLKNVHEAVDSFVGDAPQFDDLTMLGITLL